MPSIRCEAIDVSSTHFFALGKDRSGNPAPQTTTAIPGSSSVVFGPVAAQCDVMVRPIGGQAYIDWEASPAAGPARGLLLDPSGPLRYVVVRLEAKQSIAAVIASVM